MNSGSEGPNLQNEAHVPQMMIAVFTKHDCTALYTLTEGENPSCRSMSCTENVTEVLCTPASTSPIQTTGALVPLPPGLVPSSPHFS